MYYKQESLLKSANVPQMDTRALAIAGSQLGDSFNAYVQKGKDEAEKLQKEQRYQDELAYSRGRDSLQDERYTAGIERELAREQDIKDKTLATNNALAVLTDPSKATSVNTAASDITTQRQIELYNQAITDGRVTPQEQAQMDKEYQAMLRQDILSSGSVDQGKLFDANQSIEKMAMQREEQKANQIHRQQVLAEQSASRREAAAVRAEALKEKQEENQYKQADRISKLEEEINARNELKSYGGNYKNPYSMVVEELKEKQKTHWINPETNKAEFKPKTEADLNKAAAENQEDYVKLMGSANVLNLVKADSNGIFSRNDTLDILETAKRAGINSKILEEAITKKAVNNANQTFETALKYEDLNKKRVQDPENKEKWIGLGEWLEKYQADPSYFERVQSNKGFTTEVRDLSSFSKEEQAKVNNDIKTKTTENNNPFKIY